MNNLFFFLSYFTVSCFLLVSRSLPPLSARSHSTCLSLFAVRSLVSLHSKACMKRGEPNRSRDSTQKQKLLQLEAGGGESSERGKRREEREGRKERREKRREWMSCAEYSSIIFERPLTKHLTSFLMSVQRKIAGNIFSRLS